MLVSGLMLFGMKVGGFCNDVMSSSMCVGSLEGLLRETFRFFL